MKHLATAVLALALLATSGCGGLSQDEQKAAKSIGTSFAGKNPSKVQKGVGACFGKKLVTEAGVDQLKKDKVLDKSLKAAGTVPSKLSTKTAEAYADGVVTCFDFKKLKGDIGKGTGANAKQVDAYVNCLDAIPDADLKAALVDQYTKKSPTKATKKIDTKTQACRKKLGY